MERVERSFADLEYESKKRKTRRERFLERMDALIRWERLLDQIRPYYPKAGKGRGPYGLESMLRVHCVQLFYNLRAPREIRKVQNSLGVCLQRRAAVVL